MTQAALAEAAGLSAPTIGLIERNRGQIASLSLLLDALGLVITGRNLSPSGPIGVQIAHLRRSRGLSQRALAELVKVTQPTVISLERNPCRGRIETLDRVLRKLGAGAFLHKQGQPTAFYAGVGNSSANNSWTTPPELLNALYDIWEFDLDPSSPGKTRRHVKARMHYTALDDGLSLPWGDESIACKSGASNSAGNSVIFCNPPYGRGLAKWVEKCRAEVDAGRAKTVVALVPARTDTLYWHEHIAGRAAIYFLLGRLKFGGQTDDKKTNAAPFPSALVIWGAEPEALEKMCTLVPGTMVLPKVSERPAV